MKVRPGFRLKDCRNDERRLSWLVVPPPVMAVRGNDDPDLHCMRITQFRWKVHFRGNDAGGFSDKQNWPGREGGTGRHDARSTVPVDDWRVGSRA